MSDTQMARRAIADIRPVCRQAPSGFGGALFGRSSTARSRPTIRRDASPTSAKPAKCSDGSRSFLWKRGLREP